MPQDDPKRRTLLKAAIEKLGPETLPSRQLGATFKHEGNRHLFSELKQAEEDFLLHALVRQDRFGNVTAGGPDTIPEGSMRHDESILRAASAEILLDADEANRVVDAYLARDRRVFHLPDEPRAPAASVSRNRTAFDEDDRPAGVWTLLTSLFRRSRDDEDEDDR